MLPAIPFDSGSPRKRRIWYSAPALSSTSGHSHRRLLSNERVFARRSFGAGSLITFMGGFSTYALSFLLPLFYQYVRGESVLHTGLLLIPQGIGTIFYVIALRPLAARIDGRIVVAAGVVTTMIGTLPFALAGAEGDTAALLAGQFAQGIGFAATTFPVLELALSGLRHDEAARGGAAFSIVQRVGAPFGVALIAVILQRLLDTATTPSATVAAFNDTFWWIFVLSAVPLLLATALPARKTTGIPH